MSCSPWAASEGPPAENGIKEAGVWGDLRLSSVWGSSEERRSVGEEALSVSKRSEWGPGEVAEGME